MRIARVQGSLNAFALIIYLEALSFSVPIPETLCTPRKDANVSTSSRCRLTPPKETKVCPVCDSSIAADARVCPSCQTDLTLFDVSGGSSDDGVKVPVKEGRSIDEILASIMEGKDDHPEIFETLKSVARGSPGADNAGVEAESTAAAETAKELGEQFLCPVCDTLVSADATVCPGCGAEFSEGEATEYECPVCKTNVPANADHCPNCGVRFASEGEPAIAPPTPPTRAAEPRNLPAATAAPVVPPRPSRTPLQNRIDQMRRAQRDQDIDVPTGDRKLLYRELPKLVNDVKPLLVSAKRIGLEIDEGKRLINDAIQAGKGRDIERAVGLIARARRSLDVAFVDHIGSRIDTFLEEIQRAKGDAGLQAVLPRLQEAVTRLEKSEYEGAWSLYEGALTGFQSEAKDYHEARTSLEGAERLVRDVKAMGMDLREADRLARQGREALERRDATSALKLGRQAQDRLKRDVPAFVQEEMRKARNALLDLKVRGKDLGKPIGILKEASARAKQEAWGDALRYVKDFYNEVERIE